MILPLEMVVLGLAGGLHCVGMCGGFAAAACTQSSTKVRRAFLASFLTYLAGKTLAYATLGVLAAGVGRELLDSTHLHAWRQVALVAAALTILYTGLRTAGWMPRRIADFGVGAWQRIFAPLKPVFQAWTALPGFWAPAALGLLNGFIPCGLTWSAVLLAMESTRVAESAMLLVLFGVSTAPALLLPALASRNLSLKGRTRTRRVAGAALIAFSAYTLVRVLTTPTAAANECCAPTSATSEALAPLARGLTGA